MGPYLLIAMTAGSVVCLALAVIGLSRRVSALEAPQAGVVNALTEGFPPECFGEAALHTQPTGGEDGV